MSDPNLGTLSPSKRFSLVKMTADYRIIRMGDVGVAQNPHYGLVDSSSRSDAKRFGASWRVGLTLYTPLSDTEAKTEEFVFFVLHEDGKHTAWTTLLNEVLRSLPSRNTGAMVSAVALHRLDCDSPVHGMLANLF